MPKTVRHRRGGMTGTYMKSYHKKIILSVLLSLALTLTATSCKSETDANKTDSNGSANSTDASGNTDIYTEPINSDNLDIKFSKFDLDESVPSDSAKINLADGKSTSDSDGVQINGDIVRITAGGSYLISGNLSNGQIIVECADDEKVKLCFNGVDLSSSENSPVYIVSADKVAIVLCDGSLNSVTDSRSGYSDSVDDDSESDSPDAAIYSACALTISGSGKLTVNASYNDGIRSKKTLKILNGRINVGSSGTAVKGSNATAVAGGEITINAGKSGIRTSETDDSAKGYIFISGGKIEITAEKHGINASQYVLISGGEINITTTGTETDTDSSDNDDGGWGGMWHGGFGGEGSGRSKIKSKGIKAEKSVTVTGGNITVTSTGHSIASAGTVSISGDASLTLHAECKSLSANSKGIKADGDLTVSGGTVNVTYSYEGLESKDGSIIITGGSVSVVSSDDGFNVANTSGSIQICGGRIFVNASGDGFDSNGNIIFSGGTTLIAGPTSSADGALDCGDNRNYISVTGGTLIAYGSAGMAEAPSEEYSTQCSISTNTTVTEGSLVAVCDSDGNVICAFVAAENAQNIVISSPDITVGMTCKLNVGGTLDGADDTDMIYTSGKVVGGKDAAEFSISSILTGSNRGGSMGGFDGRGDGRGDGHGGGHGGGPGRF